MELVYPWRGDVDSIEWQKEDRHQVEEVEGWDERQADEPEPDDDVDLLVDDVDRQDAQDVRLLDRACWAVLSVVAFWHLKCQKSFFEEWILNKIDYLTT